MITGDVSSDHQTMWWITLGLGVVILSAVILLLGFLTIIVKDIDQGVDEAWNEAGKLATQTATTWMLNDTLNLAGELKAETKRHADVLSTAAASQS
ncbi:MAG: hypothetical protein ACRD2W_04350 [Acidimicrobiales bacterium]